MGELEDLLGEIGAEQWVRNKFVEQLKRYSEAKDTDVDKFIAEFNANILVEFKIIVKKSIDEVMVRFSELVEKE